MNQFKVFTKNHIYYEMDKLGWGGQNERHMSIISVILWYKLPFQKYDNSTLGENKN